MLGIKGVPDLVAASRLLRARNVAHRLVLAGGTDPENPDAIPEAALRRWAQEDGVEWLGAIADVRALWRRCDIAALASLGGEGLPLSLIEAAACGGRWSPPTSRARATSPRTASMRCWSRPGRPEALADALERLIRDRALRQSFAAASRGIAKSGFSSEHVSAATLSLYTRLLAQVSPRA